MARTGVRLLWLLAAVWIAALLLWDQANSGSSGPPPGIVQTYFVLTATVLPRRAVWRPRAYAGLSGRA